MLAPLCLHTLHMQSFVALRAGGMDEADSSAPELQPGCYSRSIINTTSAALGSLYSQ